MDGAFQTFLVIILLGTNPETGKVVTDVETCQMIPQETALEEKQECWVLGLKAKTHLEQSFPNSPYRVSYTCWQKVYLKGEKVPEEKPRCLLF